jgi:hypothetical protein
MDMVATERGQDPVNKLNLPPHGFGQYEVPDMPAYVQSYSKRGNQYDGETTPVYNQIRWGNKRNIGGMAAYVSQLEDDTYFEGYKVKKGDAGVYQTLRWAPGYDWRGNFGVASLSELKNYAGIPTRGGMLRKGGPRRGDTVERSNAWFENTRPGIGTSRLTQNNNNYAGLYEYKKITPPILLDNDMLVLRDMVEHNPFHISSHAAKQAKTVYDGEFGEVRDKWLPAYDDNINVQRQLDRPLVEIKESSPYMLNRP